MPRFTKLACLALAALWVAVPAHAAVTWTKVVGGVTQPVDIAGARDGTNRLFVVQQTGQVRVIRNQTLVATPFLDINTLVLATGEQGLLGIAFHPQFASNRQFYVNYTRKADGATVVARYLANAGGADTADPASGQVLLVIAQPYSNHNGGAVKFGPDGYLYIGMGDGGSSNDPESRAQDRTTLLGKMLRIDVDAGSPYAIPAGNPWANGVNGRAEIFAIGLRNPWRISFDRGTGDFWIADVGQGAIEEVNRVAAGTGAGANFGWRMMEGNNCTGLSGPVACNDASLTRPVVAYGHDVGCSVTGGFVYRGTHVPSLAGKYVYGDFCSGRLWAATGAGSAWTPAELGDTAYQLSAFGEDDAGELYFADYATGDIYRFADTVPPPATPRLVVTPSPLAFGVVAPNSTANRTVTIANGGGGTLVVTAFAITSSGRGASAFATSGPCTVGTRLTAGQTCVLDVRFMPTAAGGYASTLGVGSDAGTATIVLSGTGGTPPPVAQLRTSVSSLAFGSVALGSSSTDQTVTASNAGGGSLTLSALTPGGSHPGDFVRSGTCAVGTALAAGQSCTFVYRFTPTATGARSASLAVGSSAGSATLSLSGTGTATPTAPVLSVSSTALTFATLQVGATSVPQAVTVTNAGAGTLALTGFTLGGAQPGDFVRAGTCSTSTVLAGGQSCTVTFAFRPSAAGARAAAFTLATSAGNAAVSLSGTGSTGRGPRQ